MKAAFLDSLIGKLLGLGPIASLLEKVNLVILGLKIVVLLFVVGWVRTHVGGGRLGTFVLLLVGYLILFPYWYLFGPLAILYLLAITGVTGLAMDIVFTHQAYNPFGPGTPTVGEERAAYLNNPAMGLQSKITQMFRKKIGGR